MNIEHGSFVVITDRLYAVIDNESGMIAHEPDGSLSIFQSREKARDVVRLRGAGYTTLRLNDLVGVAVR